MSVDLEQINFQVLTIFKSGHKAGYFQVGPRPFASLSLRLTGRGTFFIAGEKLISNVGDVIYIPADTSYEVEYSVSESIVVHLLECNYSKSLSFRIKNQALAEVQFKNLLETWMHKCSVYQTKAQIYNIMDMLINQQSPETEEELFSRCVNYMKAHFYEGNTNIEAICKRLSVSRSTLQRLFLEGLGMSPHQYLTKLRLEHALVLLATGQLTIKEVSNASGFYDEKYFSTVFKKVYGYSPSCMRNNLKM